MLLSLFRKLSYRNKLLISFIFVSVIPILVLQTISYYNMTRSMKKRADDLITNNLALASKNLRSSLDSYIEALYQIYIDEEIVEMVKKMNNDPDNRAIAFNTIRRKLVNFVSARDGIRSIAILCKNGDIAFYDPITISSIESIWSRYEDVSTIDIYNRALESNQMVLGRTEFVEKRGVKDYYLFHIAKKMHDFKNLDEEGIGVAVISINEEIIHKALNNMENVNDIPDNTVSINFVIDNEGNIISFPDKSFISRNINNLNGTVKNDMNLNINELLSMSGIFDGRAVNINYRFDSSTNWTIINAVDRKYLFNDIYRLQVLTIGIGLVAVMFSIIFTLYISNSFSESISKILNAMKTAQEGELTVQVEVDGSDEISLIASRFNKMISRIDKLIQELKIANHKQKEAEIRALEAQINPHFLYNTLDSINWMAIEKDEHEISRMLKSLAQILRYSVNKSNKIVTVREELEWLKQYIYLQQNRFNYSFECRVDIDDSLLDYKIHKLLLQPFIENAIVHGFEGCSSGGLLNIEMKPYEEDCFRIVIEDNGRGIRQEMVDKLNNEETDDIIAEGSGIGIGNIFRRIKMYYGDKGKWNVCSSIGKGTRIELIIPVKTDNS